MSLLERVAPKLRKIAERFDELDRSISDPEVAGDSARLTAALRERGRLESTVRKYRELEAVNVEILDTEAELSLSSDPEMRRYCEELLGSLEAKKPLLERELLSEYVRDEDDAIDSAIVEVRAGTGGDEASLWAGDLFRMYVRYCERQGFKIELLDESKSSVDGFKEVIFGVTGPGCFSRLRYESGGHRVQRIPETETQGRIHTSAATVAVLPEATEVQVEIRDSDLRIDSFRSSGPGGQNVNKTSSAIRITHLPSGLVVSCQDEKSQHKNKAKALKILRSRLFDLERQRQHNERAKVRKTQIGSGDRSERIRTFNFPQSRVTDHRINMNLHNLQAVLDGDLGTLIDALVQYDREQRLEALATEV